MLDRPLTAAQMRELARRVDQSPVFVRSPALRAFLSYIVENAITGNFDQIKEKCIGTVALGRGPNYDPITDNIVRVRAHELRQKLKKHFETEGIHERVVISVPRGTYVPEFHSRNIDPPPVADFLKADSPAHDAVADPSKPETPSGVPVQAADRRRIWRPLPWFLVIALAAALAFTLLHYSGGQRMAKTTQPQQAVRDFWGPLFAQPGRPVLAISADSGFALWQNLNNRELNLGDYLARNYPQLGPPDPRMRELAARRLTSPADVAVTGRLGELSQALGGHLIPEYSRDVQVQQFRNSNAVLIGSRRSNPWVELFEAKMNFVVVRDNKTGASFFQNRSPEQGEEQSYGVSEVFASLGTEVHEVDSYALIALVPGLAENARVVLVEGLNMEGTEAAGEMVTNPAQLAGMLRQMGHQSGTPVSPFEALLKLTSVPGGYAYSKAIALRHVKK